MGKAKSSNTFIENQSKRNSCYRLKKQTLFKKARELSILCNVPTCVIVFPNSKAVQPEVVSYNGEEEEDRVTLTRTIVDRYLACPKDGNNKKRSSNLSDVLGDDFVANNDEKSLIRANNDDLKYNNLTNLTQDQLIQLLGKLDDKLNSVTRKINEIKGIEIDQILDDIQSWPSDHDEVWLDDLLELTAEDHSLDVDQRQGFSELLMGPTFSCYDVDQRSYSELLMGSTSSCFDIDQGSGFVDSIPLQCCFPTMGGDVGPTFCNQGSGFIDNYSLDSFGRPIYCDQEFGFVGEDLTMSVQSCNNNGYLMLSDTSLLPPLY